MNLSIQKDSQIANKSPAIQTKQPVKENNIILLSSFEEESQPIKSNNLKEIIESSLSSEESFTDSLAQAQSENAELENKLKAQRLLLEQKTKQKNV